MENRNMWPLVVGVVAIVGIIAWVATRNDNVDNDQPTGVIGHVVEGVGDKIDQAGNQAKADANASSADANFDAAKEKIGITPEEPAAVDTQ